jgi:hypothetical protein
MWRRLAKAAETLDLTACPVDNTLDQLLLSPWLEPGVYKYMPLNKFDKSRLRIARLLSWNDILDDHPASSESLIVPLESAKAKINAATFLSNGERILRRAAWRNLHNHWPSLLEAMKDEWKLALRRSITVHRPQRHWLKPANDTHMMLPPHLLLAGVPANKYSVHTARRYQTDKEREKEILPARHRPRLVKNGWDVASSDSLTGDSDDEDAADDEEELNPEDEAAAILRQQQPGANLMGTLQRSIEADKFYSTLDKCMRRLKLTPDIYSAVYSCYQGRLPYFDATCCQGERASRIHRLFSCCRANRVWLHMYQSAGDIGLPLPTLSQGECVELFPRWLQWNTAQKYRRKQWASEANTTEAQLKMLLIATHTYVLVKFMFKPVADEEGEVTACLNQIKAILLDYTYIQEQITLTKQLRHSAATSRVNGLQNYDMQSESSDIDYDEEDQEDQEGRLEANGEINFWHCY